MLIPPTTYVDGVARMLTRNGCLKEFPSPAAFIRPKRMGFARAVLGCDPLGNPRKALCGIPSWSMNIDTGWEGREEVENTPNVTYSLFTRGKLVIAGSKSTLGALSTHSWMNVD